LGRHNKNGYVFEMMYVTISCSTCYANWYYWFAADQVEICTKNSVIPTIGGSIQFTGE
jgi:hypothetical protein